MKKRGQISFEYLMIMGFVTFVIMILLGIAFYYSSTIKDKLKSNEIDGYAAKIISSAETVFYEGYPAKTTVMVNLPEGVTSITTYPGSSWGEGLQINYTTSGGISSVLKESNVPIIISYDGNNYLPNSKGTRRILLKAEDNGVNITRPA
jgi:hypothetical protein